MSERIVSALARGRLYYGWFIVGVVLSGGIPRVGLNGSFFGIFLKPMSEEFGWTRAETTWAVTIGTLAAAAMGVYLGRVLDRFGPRWMMAGGFGLLAASYFGLAYVTSLLTFYIAFSVGRSMMQSATGHQLMYALVSKWFVRRRARAISAATLGGYIGGIVLAPVVQAIIDGFTWRAAWIFFGALTLAMAVVPAIVLLRRLPEDLGLRPDGDAVPAAGAAPSDKPKDPNTERPSLTQRQALRSVPFWLLTVMVTVNALGTTGVSFHMVPHFSDVGLSSVAAASAITFLTTGSIASTFVWGYLSDKIGAKVMLMGSVATLALATFAVANADNVPVAYLGATLFGIGLAGTGLLSEVVWADFFGRMHLGSIRGATIPFQMSGNAFGSLIAAYVFDLRGSYDDAFKIVLVLFAISFAMLALARRPQVRP